MTLTIPPARSDFDISHDYHIQLLSKALNYALPKHKIKFKDSFAMSQGRAQLELIKGDNIDVYWFGTNLELEDKLRAIPVPTTRGLIGYRKFIIHKDSKVKFDKVTNLDDLKDFVACQGMHWPDTKILTRAGLPVTTSATYEHLFAMTNMKRCDYFPRGYHDALNELKVRKNKYSGLISYQRILLHYPFAVYFFTNQSQHNLASKIEFGLKKMIANNEISRLMSEHPLTKSIYPLQSQADTLYLKINNPLMKRRNTANKQYWITPEDFKILPNQN